MLASHFPGRIRIAAPALGREEVAERAARLLSGLPGVTGTRLNARAASLVITYDPAVIDPAGVPGLLARYAAMLLPGGAAAATAKPTARIRPGRAVAVLEKKALLGLWVLTLGLLLAGNKTGHVAAGTALAALTARHVLTRRAALLR